MNRCSYFCAGWWPILLVPLLLLLLFIIFTWRSVEADVSLNAESVTRDDGDPWAVVMTRNRGRDVLLLGTAPSEKALTQAIKKIENAEGVRVVEFKGTVAPPKPTVGSELNINFPNIGEVLISGVLDTQKSLNLALTYLSETYPGLNIITNMSVDENRLPITDLKELITSTKILNRKGAIRISNNNLTISGEASDKSSFLAIEETFTNIFDGGIENLMTITKAIQEPDSDLDNSAVTELAETLTADAPIEELQCEEMIKEALLEQTIHFETDSAIIKNQSLELIEKIVSITKRCEEAKFKVIGHTDSSGTAELNMILSKARAIGVVDLLADYGVNRERFEALGYGSAQPIASNKTVTGRAKNRRIEFKLKN